MNAESGPPEGNAGPERRAREVFQPPGSHRPSPRKEAVSTEPRKVELSLALVGGVLIAVAALLVVTVLLAWALVGKQGPPSEPSTAETVSPPEDPTRKVLAEAARHVLECRGLTPEENVTVTKNKEQWKELLNAAFSRKLDELEKDPPDEKGLLALQIEARRWSVVDEDVKRRLASIKPKTKMDVKPEELARKLVAGEVLSPEETGLAEKAKQDLAKYGTTDFHKSLTDALEAKLKKKPSEAELKQLRKLASDWKLPESLFQEIAGPSSAPGGKYYVCVGKNGAVGLPSDRIPEKEQKGWSYAVMTLPKELTGKPVLQSTPVPLVRYANNLKGGKGGSETLGTVISGEKGIDVSALGLPSGSAVLLRQPQGKEALLIPGGWEMDADLPAFCGQRGKMPLSWVDEPLVEGVELRVKLESLRPELKVPRDAFSLEKLEFTLQSLADTYRKPIAELKKTVEDQGTDYQALAEKAWKEQFEPSNFLRGVGFLAWQPYQKEPAKPKRNQNGRELPAEPPVWAYKVAASAPGALGKQGESFMVGGPDPEATSFLQFCKDPTRFQRGTPRVDRYVLYLTAVCRALLAGSLSVKPLLDPGESFQEQQPRSFVEQGNRTFCFAGIVTSERGPLATLSQTRALIVPLRGEASLQSAWDEFQRFSGVVQKLYEELQGVNPNEIEPQKRNRNALIENLKGPVQNFRQLWMIRRIDAGIYRPSTQTEKEDTIRELAEYQALEAALRKPEAKESADVLAKWLKVKVVFTNR